MLLYCYLDFKQFFVFPKILLVSATNNQLKAMEQIWKVLNLVLKFDLRDDPNEGTYSLL